MSTLGQLYSLRGTIRLARYRLRNHRPSLDRAVSHLERSAARLAAGHADRPLVLAALSNALIWRYELTSEATDLDRAIPVLRESIASPGRSAAERATARGDLAAALRSRFLRYGDPADLDEAVEAATIAIRDADDPTSAVTNRALALLARFEQTADVADLLAAVRDASEPVHGPVKAALHRGLRLGGLIAALGARYQYTDDRADLDGAIAAGREALATLSRFDPYRAHYANEFSEVLRRSDDPALLDEAVQVAEEAVRDSSPTHIDHANRLSTLSMALLMRHLAAGDIDDLRRARDLGGQALAAGDVGRPQLLQRVGLLARCWYHVTSEPAALEDGERAVREALTMTSPGDPLRDALTCELADLLRQGPDDGRRRTEARELLANAVRAKAPARSMHEALRAAARLAELAAEDDRVQDALLGYRRAVELLPTAAWPGLRRAVREARLAEAPRATDAAAVAIRATEPELAVELLEAGRSVLWSQQLGRRTDLDRLRDAAPAVAERMNEIRVWFERPTAEMVGSPDPVSEDGDRRMALAREWDELVAQVRELSGFEDLLRPPRFETLLHAAAGGPVVILNVSGWRCDALVVRTSGVTVVELPNLTEDGVVEQVQAYLTAVGARQSETGRDAYPRDLTPAGREHGGESTLDDCLRWMWDGFAADVLDHLGHSSPPASGAAWPRVWWCPTGPLTLLPIHAAGDHRTPGAAVVDRVISSYTPTLRALLEARDESRTRTTGPERMLFVGMPETPGQVDLPEVMVERKLIGRLFTDHCTELLGSAATRAGVLTALPDHSRVHFACHGEQNLGDPSRGSVLLQDGPLSVADLSSRQFQGEFAYLSGCKTAVGGVKLPDEAITLAAALHYTGYRHVIATLWSVWDADAARVAEDVYAALVHDGVLDAGNAARALHEAVRRLRDIHPDRPGVWMPFAHTGP